MFFGHWWKAPNRFFVRTVKRKIMLIKVLLLGIIIFLKKYDPILQKHFKIAPKNSLYYSDYVQNYIIALISIVIK
jgi:hypothetical protein